MDHIVGDDQLPEMLESAKSDSAAGAPAVANAQAQASPSRTAAMQPGPNAITWTASEYIEHQRPSNWYLLVGLAAAGAGIVVWILTRDLFPSTAVAIGIALLGVYGARKPRQEQYTLDEHGLTIGDRRYLYHEFRSFKIIPEGAFTSIELTPLKRFAVGMTLFFDPADEDRIVDQLSQHLPLEEGTASLTDSVMRRIKF